MKLAALLLDNTTKNIDKVYYYEAPSRLIDKLITGVRVTIPFGKGNSLRVAYFLSFVDEKVDYDLKKIIDIVDEQSVLSENMFKLAQKIRSNYFCTYSQAINIMIPSGAKMVQEKYVYSDGVKVKLNTYCKQHKHIDFDKLSIETIQKKRVNIKSAKHIKLAISIEEAIDLIESFQLKNEKQIRLLELLVDYEEMMITDLQNYENISRSIINTMANYGYINIFDKEIKRTYEEVIHEPYEEPAKLTNLQQLAIKKLSPIIKASKYDKYLIKGVTGSGKTEIYLQLAKEAVSLGKDVIILVPEISLTPMMISRFMGRFDNKIAVLHSRLSVLQRYEEWGKIKNGQVKIALGARSCLFAPFNNLGLIIIDEEQETSYKSETTPKYHAVDVANMRCQIDNSLLLLGSATPSVTTYKVMSELDRVITIDKRIANASLPQVSVVDMREEISNGKLPIFSKLLIEEIIKNLEKKEQTMLFLNRRGYSSLYVCHDCGETIQCDNCDVSMTYHKSRKIMMCHYCGAIKQISNICPTCKSNQMKKIGVGTQQIEEAISQQFPNATMIRMDLDTTGYRNSHGKILRKFQNEKIDILIGTQMIAKGHDFENVTLVGILSADSLTNGFSIYAQERAFQLITQAAGRAGRGSIPGRAIIQAYDIDNHAIKCGITQDYYEFYNYEISLREQLGYPPFGIIGKIIMTGLNEQNTLYWTNKANEVLQQLKIDVSYTAKAPIGKINRKYRYRIVVTGNNYLGIIKKLKTFYNHIYKKLPNDVKCSIDIDGNHLKK